MDKSSRNCLIGCCICGIVTFIIIVVVVVVLCVYYLGYYVSIDQYTAEMYTDYSHNHAYTSQLTVFNDYKYSSRQAFDGVFIGNVFSDEFYDYSAVCNHVGDHDSCYYMTSDSYAGFYISHAFYDKEAKGIDCPKIRDPILSGSKKRTLTKCDKYSVEASSDTQRVKQVIYVESDTDYPVLVNTEYHDRVNGELQDNVTQMYTSFDGSEPTDTSVLKPPADAQVWDFRTKTNSASSSMVSRFLFRLKNKVNIPFKLYNLLRKELSEDPIQRQFDKQSFLRNLLNLPLPAVGGPAVGATPSYIKRRRVSIPDSFDAREGFATCSDVISNITNQESCGSCWAMSTTGTISDRACIRGLAHQQYAPQYMVDCYPNQMGCNGGFAGTVLEDAKKYGVVPESCYPFDAKDHDCPTKCADGSAITDDMKIKVKDFFSPWGKTDAERVEAIQTELMTNGPLAVSYLVFDDFYQINGGVYKRRANPGSFRGGHMVRLIGWGKENNMDYWLCANSWGTDWNNDGLFKIRRGTNECNIENQVIAALV